MLNISDSNLVLELQLMISYNKPTLHSEVRVRTLKEEKNSRTFQGLFPGVEPTTFFSRNILLVYYRQSFTFQHTMYNDLRSIQTSPNYQYIITFYVIFRK